MKATDYTLEIMKFPLYRASGRTKFLESCIPKDKESILISDVIHYQYPYTLEKNKLNHFISSNQLSEYELLSKIRNYLRGKNFIPIYCDHTTFEKYTKSFYIKILNYNCENEYEGFLYE